MWQRIMEKIVRFLDPKLEKYRNGAKKESRAEIEAKCRKNFVPESLEEFVKVIKRTPKAILSEKDRTRIAAVMSFNEKKVADLMVKRAEMVFVNEKDFLGPLMLDKLYKSGFTNFPVVNNDNHVKGVIHTEALNALAIKKTDRAEKYIDKNVLYLHEDDSLKFVVTEISRTNAHYFLVLDEAEALAGFFTVEMLLDYLLGL